MALRNDVEEEVSGLYLTTLSRSPDSAGVAYWVDQVMNDKMTVAEVGQSFFDQTEVKAKYDGLDTTAFVQAVYQNVLGRVAEQDGLDYWVQQLNDGIFTNDRFIEAVNAGATGDDATRLMNLKDVGFYYMKKVGSDIDLGASVLSSITADSTTVTEALKLIEYYSLNSASITATDEATVDGWRGLSALDSITISENIGTSSIALWNNTGIFSNETTNMYATYGTPSSTDEGVTAPPDIGLPPIPQFPTQAPEFISDTYVTYDQSIDFFIA